MPPLPLTKLLQTALPGLSARSRALVNTLACYNGDPPLADDVAALVGMRSRYQLARALRHEGLPSLEELAGWARTLYWLVEAETTGASLRQLAQHVHLEAATAYRLVHRVTGMRWSELRRAGSATTVLRLRNRCEPYSACRGPERLERPIRRQDRAFALGVPSPVIDRWDADPMPAGGWLARGGSRRVATRHPAGVLGERLHVSGSPFDVAIGWDGDAFVTRVHAAAVDRLRLDPLRATGTIRTGAAPTRVVLSPTGTDAYVTSQFAEEVGIIDLPSARQVGAMAVPGHPMPAAISRDGCTLYVATNLDRLYALSLRTRHVVASLPVPQICTEIALDPTGRRLYVPTWRAGVILEVDARTLRTTRTFRVAGKVQGLVVSSDARTLLAANEDGWLDVIRLCTGRPAARLQFGSAAFGVALSPDDAVVYVSLLVAGDVVVIDGHTLEVVTTLHPGGRPRRIAFDGTGRQALIANEAGWVDVVR